MKQQNQQTQPGLHEIWPKRVTLIASDGQTEMEYWNLKVWLAHNKMRLLDWLLGRKKEKPVYVKPEAMEPKVTVIEGSDYSQITGIVLPGPWGVNHEKSVRNIL